MSTMTPTAPPEGKLLLTLTETCYLMGCRYTYIYELASRGELPGVMRTGRTYKVHRPTLERWLEDQAQGGAA